MLLLLLHGSCCFVLVFVLVLVLVDVLVDVLVAAVLLYRCIRLLCCCCCYIRFSVPVRGHHPNLLSLQTETLLLLLLQLPLLLLLLLLLLFAATVGVRCAVAVAVAVIIVVVAFLRWYLICWLIRRCAAADVGRAPLPTPPRTRSANVENNWFYSLSAKNLGCSRQ